MEHYRLLHRYCVFSHDEMICKMASKADVLDVVVASTVQKDMAIMVEDEKALRETVRQLVRPLESRHCVCQARLTEVRRHFAAILRNHSLI